MTETFKTRMQDKILTIVLFGMLFSLTPIAIEYWVLSNSEREDFFEYQATEIRKGSVAADDDAIRVYSYAQIKQPVFIKYKDVLWCKTVDSEGFEFTDSNETSAMAEAGTLPRMELNDRGDKVDVPWRFSVDANLQTGDRCQIRSKVTAELRFGITHTQEIISNTFTVQ